MKHRKLLRIDLKKLRLIFHIHKHVTLVVTGSKLRLPAHRDHARNLAISGVDSNRVGASTVEGENAFRARVVVDRIGVQAPGLDRINGLEGLQIEDDDGIGPTRGDKAAVQIGRQRDTVDAQSVGDVADDDPGIRVQHNHVIAVRNIHPAGSTVYDAIVLAALAADRYGFQDVIARRTRRSLGEDS